RHGVVVEMDVGNFYIRVVFGILSHHVETVVLGSDFTFSGNEIFDRMIQSSVSVVHLVGFYPYRFTQKLVSEANSEERLRGAKDFFDRLDGVIHHRWITRAIGKEVSIR